MYSNFLHDKLLTIVILKNGIMKTKLVNFLVIVLIPIIGLSQTEESFEFISPFSDEVAAVKKGTQWAFIDKDGAIIVDFRDDLVISESNDLSYPVFINDRCLIQIKKDGIKYFGYIDKSGKTIIEPKFLNAQNFKNNKAIVLELVKKNVGKNNLLDKNIVYYKYFEVVIDTEGKVLCYLNEKGTNVVLDKEFLRNPPVFSSKIMSDNLVALLNENKEWVVRRIIE